MLSDTVSSEIESNPAKAHYVYRRSDRRYPFITIFKTEGLGARPWVLSVQINIGERYIDSYHDVLEKSTARAKQIISLLTKKYPGVYILV